MPESGEQDEREQLLAFLEAHWPELTLREASLLSVERLSARFGAWSAGSFKKPLMFD